MRKVFLVIWAVLTLALFGGSALSESAETGEPWPFADVSPEDAVLFIHAEGDPMKLAAGSQLQFSASFASPGKINAEAENDQVLWSLLDRDGQEIERRLAHIDENGLLQANITVRSGLDVVVTAQSAVYGTKAEYPLLLYPPALEVRLAPEKLEIYLSQKNGAVVRASTRPANLQRTLTWKISNPEIAEFTVNDDGSVTVFAKKPGATRLTAYADNGVRNYIPLEVPRLESSIRILGDEYVRQGGTLELTAMLGSRAAEPREVYWSIDVDESIATISTAGRLRPTAACPVGTKITVTCRPRHADGDVYATKEIVVTYQAFKLNRK